MIIKLYIKVQHNEDTLKQYIINKIKNEQNND